MAYKIEEVGDALVLSHGVWHPTGTPLGVTKREVRINIVAGEYLHRQGYAVEKLAEAILRKSSSTKKTAAHKAAATYVDSVR